MDKSQLQEYLDKMTMRQASIQSALQQAQGGVNQLTQELIHCNGAISAAQELIGACADMLDSDSSQVSNVKQE